MDVKIMRKNAVLFLKVFAILFFISQEQVPDKYFTPYLLSLSFVKVGGNYRRWYGSFYIGKESWECIKGDLSKHKLRCCMQAGRSLNTKVYKADYFELKLRVDQNEKFVMYGVTNVVACNRYSEWLLVYTAVGIKNNFKYIQKNF